VGGTVSSTRVRSVDSRAPRASPRDRRRVVEHFSGRREVNFYDRHGDIPDCSPRDIRWGILGNGSGAPRTHRAGHAVLRGPLDVNGQGRHGTGVWMRKTRIRFATRAYRPPNDPLPRSRNNFWGWSVTNSPSFRVSVEPDRVPRADPRRGAPGVPYADDPPVSRPGRVHRQSTPACVARPPRHAGMAALTSRACGRARGGVSLGISSSHRRPRTSQKGEPEFLESRDPLRQGATNPLDFLYGILVCKIAK